MRRFRGTLLLVITVFALWPIVPAEALVCYLGERNTFVRRQGTGLFDSRGGRGRIPIRNSALGACPGLNDHHATIHMRGTGNNQLDWIEIGWFKEDDGSGPLYRGFVEYGINNTIVAYGEFGDLCNTFSNVSPHSARFKTFNLAGTFDWALHYDAQNDGTYCSVGFFYNTVMMGGLATGETGIFGGDDTNAYDHSNILYYATQPNDAGWLTWPGNIWYSAYERCIPGWGRHWLGANDFEIQLGFPCPE